MEIQCDDHSHVKILQPPITLISLQPACRAFSSDIKLPPYFKQYSKSFHVALKSANLHISKFTPTKFRIFCTHLILLNVTQPEVHNLRKVASVPAIPIGQLRAQIANLSLLILLGVDLGFTMLEVVQDLV